MTDENVITELDDTDDSSTGTTTEEPEELEPSGYVTKDGKDLDERYLHPKDKTSRDDILDTVLYGLGIIQQSTVTGTTNPYTMPRDGFITWYGKLVHEGIEDYDDYYNYLHFWVNDEEVHVIQSSRGNWDVTGDHSKDPPNASGTITRTCRSGDILKVTGTGASARMKVSQRITITPYALYRYDKVDEVTG